MLSLLRDFSNTTHCQTVSQVDIPIPVEFSFVLLPQNRSKKFLVTHFVNEPLDDGLYFVIAVKRGFVDKKNGNIRGGKTGEGMRRLKGKIRYTSHYVEVRSEVEIQREKMGECFARNGERGFATGEVEFRFRVAGSRGVKKAGAEEKAICYTECLSGNLLRS